jgi:hypothetical protein
VLWYKAWLETRSRFLTSLVNLTIFCAVFVGNTQGLLRPKWTADYNRLLLLLSNTSSSSGFGRRS